MKKKTTEDKISSLFETVLEIKLTLNYLMDEIELPTPKSKKRRINFSDPVFNELNKKTLSELDTKVLKAKCGVIVGSLENGVKELRTKLGVDIPNAAEGEQQVITLADKIKTMHESGLHLKDIGKYLGIHPTTINHILRGFKPWQETANRVV